jgi:exosortase
LGLAASVVAVGAACRELLHFQPLTHMNVSLTGDVEDFFFEPSDSSPLIVVGLCGWLLWRRRNRLAACWGQRGPVAVTALCWLVSAVIFSWSILAGAPDLQALALIPALLGTGNLLGGLGALRLMAFPSAVLVFAVPIPAAVLNQLVWFLQIQTAEFTGLLLALIGVPALVSGDRIILSDGLFAIIETCSGIRSIETLLLLAILMIDLFGRRGWHAVVLMSAAPLVAFLINGFRCLGLIFNPHADIASIHSVQGIAMLLGGVLLLYFLDGLLERLGGKGVPPSGVRARGSRPARTPLGLRVGVVVAFSVFLLGASWLPPFEAESLETTRPVEVLDARLAGFDASEEKNDWLFLGTTAFGHIVHRRYAVAGDDVDVFIGQVDTKHRLRTYLSPKVAYPGSGWIVESETRTRLAGRDVNERVLRKGANRLLVVHWFEGSPGVVAETIRGLFALDASPLPRTQIPIAVRLSTRLPSTRDAAIGLSRERLERVTQLLAPGLKELVTPGGSS